MLSVAKCRKILGDDSSKTDAELEQLRNSLYDLAWVVVESMPQQRRRGCASCGAPPVGGVSLERRQPACRPEFTAMLTEEESYLAEERAAILEFGG